MPLKRKAEATKASSEEVATPVKRVRGSMSDSASRDTPEKGTPSDDKKGRGRPRKNPKDMTPKQSNDDTPKRGRGRPKKVLTEEEAKAAEAKAAEIAARPKKGRGRPPKAPGTKKTTPARPKSKTEERRGRPRKSLPANGEESSSADAKAESKEESADEPAYEAVESDEEPTPEVPREDSGRSYWLMKAEPESRMENGVDVKFSIDDLSAASSPEPWDGVRNPVARNLMRDMKNGDLAFFYHSNCKTPGIVGVMEIVQEHSPDESAFDSKHPYYDAKSSRDDPKWVVVHVEFRRKFNKQVTLNDLKANAETGKPLENLQTLKQSRLSVSSVTPAQWRYIHELAGEDVEAEAPQDTESVDL